MRDLNRILITGGAGFIGGTLIRKILDTSNSKIFNIDKIGYASDLSYIYNIEDYKNRHKLFQIDLKDKDATLNAVKIADPDLVIHLAMSLLANY